MGEETVQYFGYGANRDPRMMAAITGNENLVGKPATLKGHGLYVQRRDQIPNTVLKSAPAPISPRTAIEENWPDSFESYVVRTDPETEVVGTVWELTRDERELAKDWELVEFGWYKDARVQVLTGDGQTIQVQTEILGDDQDVDREVDGSNYETWLMDPEDFERIATKSRLAYLERMDQKTEGGIKTNEGFGFHR